jgi:hypothetical protein
MNRLSEILRRHSFLIAAVLILWRAWSATQAAELPPLGVAEARATPPPRMGPEDFPERRADEVLRPSADPFFVELLLQQEREREAARLAAMSGPARPQAKTEEETLGVRHVLTLQATVPGSAPRAWINGQDLALGDALAGVDEATPPVLIGVQGTTAFLDYRGTTLRLDLDAGTAVIVYVKQAAAAPAPSAAPQPPAGPDSALPQEDA